MRISRFPGGIGIEGIIRTLWMCQHHASQGVTVCHRFVNFENRFFFLETNQDTRCHSFRFNLQLNKVKSRMRCIHAPASLPVRRYGALPETSNECEGLNRSQAGGLIKRSYASDTPARAYINLNGPRGPVLSA